MFINFFIRITKTFKILIRNHRYLAIILIVLLVLSGTWITSVHAKHRYDVLISNVIYDRNQVPISVKENAKGHYVIETKGLSNEFKEILIQKEDRFFYHHPGINPISTIRAFYNYITNGKAGGSSTLTQQLAKNLLGTESERNIFNKIIEAIYSISIESFLHKRGDTYYVYKYRIPW